MASIKDKSELQFENEFIDYLTKIGGVKQWEYMPKIKTTEQLWDNFKNILERNNSKVLKNKLTETEFNQVKKYINNISSPYEAGQFLHGLNGYSQIDIVLDNGETVYLTVFDKDKVGGGDTVYQVVNQIERERILTGHPNRRFDVTLLINGLPIIQIELKRAMHNAKEAFNQMKQYIGEKQYTGIYSTLQVLVAMTPHDIRYMANTKVETFNTDFAFRWQNEDDARPVTDWREFTDKVLSIPMAHELSTRYMILDGTKNKESIKVMRPYQVYATKRVIDKVRQTDFSYSDGKLGYVWHTTGSGKTITSFKTAWLASRLPNVKKVVFLVDRIALTNQTVDAYRAYDPSNNSESKTGVITDTAHTIDLHNKLTKKSDQNIIVTSIQKMSRYVESDKFKGINDNILFIVDEAHRSTGDGTDSDGMLQNIRKAIPNSGWIGYTGTPKFPATYHIFGDIIHAYTIKEAIADKNVLGFKVEFKETIKAPENPSEDEIDDSVKASVYDTSDEHVQLVVEDIFENWKKRSNNGKYNALLTVHVGGNKPSTPRAMEYFDKFNEINATKKPEDRLKVAISFSLDTSNSDNQFDNNRNLERAIKHYNNMFGTNFEMVTFRAYTDDLARRLNKTADDKNYLDLVIVVDQLLTGFDAPGLNTLYVDRTLKGSGLIQAYSRTNRLHNLIDKPWGNVINYRWPEQNEYQMNEAFYLYSNREAANRQEKWDLDLLVDANRESGVIAKPFEVLQKEIQQVVKDLAELTSNFEVVPPSERDQVETLQKVKQYNSLLSKLKQYSTDSNGNIISAYDNPEEFYKLVGITEEQEIKLTSVIVEQLKYNVLIDNDNEIDITNIDLEMVHIQEIRINYDYIVELIAQMADEVHANKMVEAEATKVKINNELGKSDNEKEKQEIRNFVDKIYNKEYIFDDYPVPRNEKTINDAMAKSKRNTAQKLIADYINKFGLHNVATPKSLKKIIDKHKVGKDDINKQNELTNIVIEARQDYKELADDNVSELSWPKYMNSAHNDFYDLADEIKRGE